MATWQFWTLIGVISAFGLYLGFAFGVLIDAVSETNKWLGMCQEHLRNLVGICASNGIDIAAIKHRVQRDRRE